MGCYSLRPGSHTLKTVYAAQHRLHSTDEVWVAGERLESREVPCRAEVIRAALVAAGLGPIVAAQDHGLAPITAVHTPAYAAYLATAYRRYAAYLGVPQPVLAQRCGVDPARLLMRPASFPELCDYYTYDHEDPILSGTWEAAYWSAQAALTAAAAVCAGDRAAYALCRPPGHHATADQYGGFCYLNNAAAAARWLSAAGRVAILDIDYHHGNGTQAIFYADPAVFYVSLHVDPAQDYPYYWGFAAERGSGAGAGTNLNLPLPLGVEDDDYLEALDVALGAIGGFLPRYLVVSLGADAVRGDPIGKFGLTSSGWYAAAQQVAGLSLSTVIVQEGGYDLDTLGGYVVAFLAAFVS